MIGKRRLAMQLFLVVLLAWSNVSAFTESERYGGALNYGEYGRASTFDPITGNDMITLRMTELLFNGLVGISEKQEIVPELAKSWKITDNGQVYTFVLRDDVLWHKGSDGIAHRFTADDVQATFDVMMHPKTITPLKIRYEFIDKVKVIAKYKITFYLKRPVLNGLAKFTFKIIPRHALRNPEYLTRDDPFVQHPIGTGPYYIKKITAANEVVFQANDKYFGGRPYIDNFVALPFADQNVMNQALAFNTIDMVVQVNPRHIPELQGDKRIILKPYNALSYAFFGYNLRNPLLSDKRVRKAFALAINRKEMLKSFFNDQGTLISGPFAPGSWAYNLDVKPLPFDQRQARELLSEAGFQMNSRRILEKYGKELSLNLKVPIAKENEALKRVVLAFKGYLRRIGVKINVQFLEWQAWKEAIFLRQDFDIMFAQWVFDDSADISSLFHSGEIGAWKNNFGGYSNAHIDRLITEAKLTLDHEKRRTINRRLHRELAEEAPYTFLWTLTNYAAYNKKLRRVAIHPYKFFSYSNKWFLTPDERN